MTAHNPACMRQRLCAGGVILFGHWETSLERFITVSGTAGCAAWAFQSTLLLPRYQGSSSGAPGNLRGDALSFPVWHTAKQLSGWWWGSLGRNPAGLTTKYSGSCLKASFQEMQRKGEAAFPSEEKDKLRGSLCWAMGLMARLAPCSCKPVRWN